MPHRVAVKPDMMRTTAVITVAVALLVASHSDGKSLGPRVFSEETSFSHHVHIPHRALSFLLNSSEVRTNINDLTPDERRNVSKYFEAEPIHLTNYNQTDLLIRGHGKMTGADNDWYWIIASYKLHPRLILFAGCTSLEIEPKKSNRYDDIVAVWWGASFTNSQLYRFDGTVYRLSRSRERTVKRPPLPASSN
jgi:hypothetical protein